MDDAVKPPVKKAALFAAVREIFGVSENTVRNAFTPAPAAPELTKERFIAIVADNLAIAERGGNEAAAKLLRRISREADSFFEHISLQ
jgi:hypothetical protein